MRRDELEKNEVLGDTRNLDLVRTQTIMEDLDPRGKQQGKEESERQKLDSELLFFKVPRKARASKVLVLSYGKNMQHWS